MAAAFDFALSPPADDDFGRLRQRIASACRGPEAEAVKTLFAGARLSPDDLAKAQAIASRLAEAVRVERSNAGGVDALMLEFSLESREGIALMCLAEALLRIPDSATRDRLIRDKISKGDWSTHIGASPSLFVNAAAWGLLVTGRIVDSRSEGTLEMALASLLRKGGEPLIRKGVDLAMRLLGRQFVTGRTIEEAIDNGREREERGYTFSFDMLGEAAMTAADATRYAGAYEHAIHTIGRASRGRGAIDGPGISLKLSALHPRFSRTQRERVMAELLPQAAKLAALAKSYGIGFSIDAEEADRLDLSLDILEQLAADPSLADWQGLGFVVQTYQKRAPLVVDWIVALARRHRRRLMVRLVKGAYWDSEIKRAQIDGVADYPVFTRKVHTDVCYLACAKAMLAATDAIYPQFASHNAFTVAAVYTLAGDRTFEFQCLHGMGESLYDEVVGKDKLDRRCRIYAPVGSHETLLAYLVRRLLENGANSSFVNRIVDSTVSIASLVVDPVVEAVRGGGAPHANIPLPVAILPGRRNSRGLDLADDATLAALAANLAAASAPRTAAPIVAVASESASRPALAVANPAVRDDIVGRVIEADADDVTRAVAIASGDDGRAWSATPAADRAACLERAADLLETERATFVGLAVREAGKTVANGIGEVREAVDFLRYYAAQARAELGAPGVEPIGPVVAISPWNFPLAIFVGEVAAALAAGNPVLAKPAEQTPLIAHEAIRLFHRAGVPVAALQFLPGRGESVGAALVADPRIAGVIFTGSTDVARGIAKQLAERDDDPVLIAETGGQNAMIVDSSALPEQVVADAVVSAFDSAGQRCSALRILCLQEDVATEMIAMLEGAMRELCVGDPQRLAVDVGPVIDADAREGLLAHVERMRAAGLRVVEMTLPAECARGTFVAPTLVDLGGLSGLVHLKQEVFGPVLHVLRWKRGELPALVSSINATGYGLTHGVHTRIDETVAAIVSRVKAGNVYINRNIVGAVVGVQPFGGHRLSGTGPKAGGPLYLRRLVRNAVAPMPRAPIALPGPTGESNTLEFHPRGAVLCMAKDERTLVAQAKAMRALGNTVILVREPMSLAVRDHLDGADIVLVDKIDPSKLDAALLDVSASRLRKVRMELATSSRAIVPVVVWKGKVESDWMRLVVERTVTVNTAAAGGNAALLSLSEDTVV
jgi:RHH-type proline utilization regulon transcriptional repressor/proline dehydrogenase/delta 1-pyrroline-5-carboxylate dehydrogenase